MENNSSFDSFELQITPVAQGYLKEIARWAHFLSIIGYIFLAFIVIAAFGMFAIGGTMAANEDMAGMQNMGGFGAMAAMGGTIAGIMYLLIAVLYFFPIYYLGKFASNAKQALANNSTDYLTNAMEYLKSHYKFIGILTLIAMVFWVLAFIIMIVAGVGAAAAM